MIFNMNMETKDEFVKCEMHTKSAHTNSHWLGSENTWMEKEKKRKNGEKWDEENKWNENKTNSEIRVTPKHTKTHAHTQCTQEMRKQKRSETKWKHNNHNDKIDSEQIEVLFWVRRVCVWKIIKFISRDTRNLICFLFFGSF